MGKQKSIEDLRMFGGYRADRHSKRETVYQSEDFPRAMKRLDGEALALWDRIVPQLIETETVSDLDSPELTALCEWWACYRQWADDTICAKVNPYKRTTGMAMAYKQFRTLAAKFYMTPDDRIGMPIARQDIPHIQARNRDAVKDRELEDLIR